jgi:maltose alpha-D-glucosyltransferase/alpha-amylase
MATSDKRYFWRDSDPLWYKDAIIYELHVRAFYDSDGDGIGDFPGLTQKLDYLQDLGVTAIWLLPFYPSPFKDDGYDVSDYTGVHPTYGTIPDFRVLVKEANYRGLRVINELILNHTSDQHPWFQRARHAASGSQGRNFYVWSYTRDKYKEARVIFKDFESSNWTWDPVANAYYWHRFYSHQPDLNFDSPLVREAIMRVVTFWLGLGVSGLRLDAVPYLYERDGTNCENLAETHGFLKELRRRVDEQFKNRMLLGEANQWPEDAVAYFGEGDECHMAYHFPVMPRLFMAIRMEERFPIIDILEHTPPIPESCQWALFLRNHDELTLEMVTDEERDYMYRVYAQDAQARLNLGIRRRLAPLLNNDRKKIELINGLLFSLPGTPVIYYGDEIGMGDNIYLGDRNGVRTPMQWSADRNAGFSHTSPQRLYLPVNIEPEYHYEAINVEAQQKNPDSLLWWMKRLIALNKHYRAFGCGSLEFLHPDNRKILAFVRRYQDETILVVANLSHRVQHASLSLYKFNGQVPVEVFGQAEFPRIGESPYFVTLSPYAFYWFSLELRQPEQVNLQTRPGEVSLPTLPLAAEWKDLYKRRTKPMLEAALLSYMRQRRWFGGKARGINSVEIQDVITMSYDMAVAHLALLKVEYTEGEPETYLIPITFASEERASQILNELPQAVIARLKLRDKDGERDGLIYDALVEQGFRSALFKAMERRRRFRGDKGDLVASHTRTVFRQIRGPTREALTSAVLKGEQTNTSVVYGDRFKLKLFRRLEEGVSPELDIGRFLTEKEPFPNVPPVAGALEYRSRRQGEPITLGVLHGYVRNEADGWDYSLDSLGRYFKRVLAQPGVEAPLPHGTSLVDISGESLSPIAQDTIGEYLVSAQLLGQRTAELHLALASATDDPNLVPEPFSVTYQRSLYHGMRGFASQVLQLLRDRLKQLPDEAKADARQVLSLEDTISGCFQELTKRKITGMRVRCHGDYHLGQVLHTGNDFVIIDFEGEPARRLGERRIKRSPLKDVASMTRSFYYAAFIALRGQASTVLRPEDLPVLKQWALAWYLWVSTTFFKSYLQFLANTPILPQSREGMKTILDAYLLDKAIYEVDYELNNRPDWVSLPLQGIVQLLVPEGQAKAPPAKKPPLTICPVCNTEFYVVYMGELPSEVYANCPNCQTRLIVELGRTGKEGEAKPDKMTAEAKKPEAIQKTEQTIEGNGGKARKEA